MECEENLGLGTVDRSEIQVLIGVNRQVIPWAFEKDRRMATRRVSLTLNRRGIMMIGKQWIQRGVLCGLVLGGLGACALIEHPPVNQVASGDHAALAAWYDKEAAQLREQAKGEMMMADAYRKNPVASTRGMATASTKVDFVQHCEGLANIYTKAAEEADLLAQGHRDVLK
jgi:hypothetical protein